MVAIQQQQQPAINIKALAWTLGVHALLFLIFFMFSYAMPAPPPVPVDSAGGLEVNLGTSDEGSGHRQPMNTKAPAPYHATVVFKSAAEKSTIAKDIVQTKEPDAPELNTNNKAKKTAPVPPVVEPPHKQPKPVEKPKYSYPGDNGQGGNNAAENKPGTNEGNGKGPGDKGVPGGAPGASNYSGTPGSGGIGHTLTSREIYPRTFIAEFNESGTVVIHVTIDRNGNIIAKNVISSSSPELTKVALEKLRGVHYSSSNDANPQDFDNITIRFQTHQ